MTDKEVMQMALDALMPHKSIITRAYTPVDAAIDALRAALAQPEPEPVAWFSKRPDNTLAIKIVGKPTDGDWEPLYTAPPQRNWQGLTKEELQEIAEFHFHGALSGREFYDDIEAKLKEKNSG